MDWDDLRYVLAIQRAGTLQGAARSLGVNRTTVGRRLEEVEERLGMRLFNRSSDGMVPTAAAEDLTETATRMESEVLAAEGRILGRDAELSGRLRVTTVEFVYLAFADIFHSFMERYPRVDLTVRISNEQVSLARREADLALRLGNHPDERLVGRRVARLQFEAYAAQSLIDRVGPGAKLGDFPWLHQDERSDGRWFDRWMAQHAAGARITLRSDDYAVLRRSVGAGMGAWFLPCVDGDADPTLRRLGARLTEEARDLWLLTLPELRHNSRIRAFMDHSQEAFRTHPGCSDPPPGRAE
ncbi:MAG TPA: LysR family transcriptional regulator [Myxococcota bacterium]|nr:LysR family transcriptional regulator [Myxococcota bacterium]